MSREARTDELARVALEALDQLPQIEKHLGKAIRRRLRTDPRWPAERLLQSLVLDGGSDIATSVESFLDGLSSYGVDVSKPMKRWRNNWDEERDSVVDELRAARWLIEEYSATDVEFLTAGLSGAPDISFVRKSTTRRAEVKSPRDILPFWDYLTDRIGIEALYDEAFVARYDYVRRLPASAVSVPQASTRASQEVERIVELVRAKGNARTDFTLNAPPGAWYWETMQVRFPLGHVVPTFLASGSVSDSIIPVPDRARAYLATSGILSRSLDLCEKAVVQLEAYESVDMSRDVIFLYLNHPPFTLRNQVAMRIWNELELRGIVPRVKVIIQDDLGDQVLAGP